MIGELLRLAWRRLRWSLRRPRPGETGTLDYRGVATFWLAGVEMDFDALVDAENQAATGKPGAGSAISKLASSGRATRYRAGAHVRVLEVRGLRCHVEMLDEPDRGRRGWVQLRFVKRDGA
jgi:hypothetical protein